jgi:hypothetical protein
MTNKELIKLTEKYLKASGELNHDRKYYIPFWKGCFICHYHYNYDGGYFTRTLIKMKNKVTLKAVASGVTYYKVEDYVHDIKRKIMEYTLQRRSW